MCCRMESTPYHFWIAILLTSPFPSLSSAASGPEWEQSSLESSPSPCHPLQKITFKLPPAEMIPLEGNTTTESALGNSENQKHTGENFRVWFSNWLILVLGNRARKQALLTYLPVTSYWHLSKLHAKLSCHRSAPQNPLCHSVAHPEFLHMVSDSLSRGATRAPASGAAAVRPEGWVRQRIWRKHLAKCRHFCFLYLLSCSIVLLQSY